MHDLLPRSCEEKASCHAEVLRGRAAWRETLQRGIPQLPSNVIYLIYI